MQNRSSAHRRPRICRRCGRRLLRRLGLFVPLHSKDAANFHGYLEPSMRLFWPDAWLVAGIDSDDHRGFEMELLAGGVVSEVRRVGRRPRSLQPWGWQMLLSWLECEKLKAFDFVGIVDSDGLFTAPVVEETLFEDGRPVMLARVGPPRSAAWVGFPVRTWAWLAGIPWRVDCMTHFPFIVYREHLTEFRQYIELLHRKNFTAAYILFANHDFYMLHTAFCNFLWELPELRLAYSWHLMEEPGPWEGNLVSGQAPLKELRRMRLAATASHLPWPGASIHAGHWQGMGKLRGGCRGGRTAGVPQCGPSPRPSARTARILLEGICRSLPAHGETGLPRACEAIHEAELFPALFSHTSDERGWLVTDPAACLEAQRTHFARVRRALATSPAYVAGLRTMADLLQVQARGAEMRAEDMEAGWSNELLELECIEDFCLRSVERDRAEIVSGLGRALELLLRARDAYREAEAAAQRVGFTLENNELRDRVFTGL